MRLSINYYSNTNNCPVCNTSLDIESTYEDTLADCWGDAVCPKCKSKIYIETNIVVKITKRVDKK